MTTWVTADNARGKRCRLLPTCRNRASNLRTRRHGAGALACALLVLVTLVGCSRADPLSLFNAGDYERSLAAFRSRAAAGDADASNFVGIHYYLGAGVGRDFGKAAEWFLNSAMAGNASAQRNLGVMYLRGLGVPQNYHHAWGWLYYAHAGGNAGARDYLDLLVDNVTPNASGKAREWVAEQLRGRPTAVR